MVVRRTAYVFFRSMHHLLVLFGVFCVIGLIGLLAVLGHIYSRFDGTAAFPVDCAVVFGAAVYGSSLPGPAIVRRVGAAAELYREGSVKRIILSGGKGAGNRQSEAQVMLTQAVAQGIAREDIVLEQESHSTWENLLYSRPLTEGCLSTVGVSDRYHLARIELLARRQGWDDLTTAPAGGELIRSFETRSLLREIVAFIYYALRIDAILPKSGVNDTAQAGTYGSKDPVRAIRSIELLT